MTSPFTVFVLTTSRADFGIYGSVLTALEAHPDLSPELVVTGMHMSIRHGVSMGSIEASGYPIAAHFSCLENRDLPEDIARSMARATHAMADILRVHKPDVLLILGDRFEMLAAAMAAVPFAVPIAHIHGGEETEGAIDNVFRHMMTKMSQLHFAATERSGARIRQMGEANDRVFVTGAPALDSIQSLARLSRDDILVRFGLDMDQPYYMVTYHPVTLDFNHSMAELRNLLRVLEQVEETIVFSGTNADTGGTQVQTAINEFASSRKNVLQVDNFGAQAYYTVMEHAVTMIGNSSSGIIEAASVGLPVVNIGSRQDGRERSANIIDTDGTIENIKAALQRAQTINGRDFENIYCSGGAGGKIATAIAAFLNSGATARKSFADRIV